VFTGDRLNICDNLRFALLNFCLGDPTDNLQTTYDWLQGDEVDDETLKGQKFAVFGLGNTTYEYFNAMGIYFDKRLEELGGKRICDCGSGDDDANIEEDFNTWKELFWISVCKEFGVR
jgi:NADPH-ferrihemoprotein reductase